jgi:aryl-alcohol dehydrogenase-like predicted oxidoreductase
MQYVNFGGTGLRVSRICLGTMSFGTSSDRPWALSEEAAEPIVRAAIDGGVTFFDTADAYNGGASEVITGRLLGKFFRRDEVVLATKIFFPTGSGQNDRGLSRKHVADAVAAGQLELSEDEMQRLEEPYLPHPVLGHE